MTETNLYVRVTDICAAMKISESAGRSLVRLCFDPTQRRYLNRDTTGARLVFYPLESSARTLRQVCRFYDGESHARLCAYAHQNVATYLEGTFSDY
mgnify:FL=1